LQQLLNRFCIYLSFIGCDDGHQKLNSLANETDVLALCLCYGPLPGTLPPGTPGTPDPPGLLGAARGRSGGKFKGSSSLFWSTGVIFVVGRACCSVIQFDNALSFSVF